MRKQVATAPDGRVAAGPVASCTRNRECHRRAPDAGLCAGPHSGRRSAFGKAWSTITPFQPARGATSYAFVFDLRGIIASRWSGHTFDRRIKQWGCSQRRARADRDCLPSQFHRRTNWVSRDVLSCRRSLLRATARNWNARGYRLKRGFES